MPRTRISSLVLAGLSACLLAAAPALAQRGDDDLKSMDILPNPTLHGQLTLALADAVAMGIENNLDLQVERFDPLISFEDKEISWGAYDPVGSAEFGRNSRHDPTSNVFQGGDNTLPLPGQTQPIKRSTTRTTDGEVGISSLIPFVNAQVDLTFSGNRITTNSPIQNFSPEYNTRMQIDGRLPLLKGLVWNEPWTRVKTAAVDYRGSQETFRTSLMDIVTLIENAYWTVVANAEGVRVAKKSVETAAALLDQTKTQYEVGVVSRVEVVEAEAGLAQREFELIRADNLYWNSQDDLIDAIMGTRLTADSRIEILPADNPDDYVRYEIDVNSATEAAFENRPELRQASLAIERQELQLKFAKNNRLPSLDVVGSYAVSGLRGKADIPGQSNGSSIGDTYTDWFSPDGGKDYTVRGVVSIPLGNIAGRHGVSKAQLELRKRKTEYVRLRQNIILQVREQARDLASAQEGIVAAEERREAAAEQLRAEQVRLEYGESTPFNVLEREEDLFEAENQRIGALQLYRTSVVNLHRAQGTILKTRNIVVEEAASLR